MTAVTLARSLARPIALRARWDRPALAGILALAAFLNCDRLSQNGYANTYYAGAVRTMLTSWHSFFYVAFDQGGLTTVDKPPLALWVQAASAKLFGLSSLSLLLPEAIAGVATVWLLALLVGRAFGRTAGLLAALALAVSPVSVAIDRDNNPDALLVLLLVAACLAGARAAASGRLRTLVLCAVLVGLAFNTKMLVAYLVVPGIAAAALLAPLPLRRRIRHLAVATLALVAVSGAWIAAVALTPASSRPWVGSTSDDNVVSLLLGYNGIGRVAGQTGGTSANGGLGGAFSGTPGLLRLLNDALGDQIAWLLPLALVGGLSAVLAARRSSSRRQTVTLVAIGGWFLAAAAVFSFSDGIVHTYYVSALAPPLVALAALGAVPLARDAVRGGAWVALPVAAIVLTATLQVALLRRSDYLPWLQPLVILGASLACAVLAALAIDAWPARVRRAGAGAAIGVATACALAAPTAWSATTRQAAVNGVFPGAGPTFVSSSGFGGGGTHGRFGGRPAGGTRGGGFTLGGGDTNDVATALSYAKAHGATTDALVVASEEDAAASVAAGESVAALGGFTGRETVLSSAYLARSVADGTVRFFLLGDSGGFGLRTANAGADTIAATCPAVSATAWGGSGSETLYDCAGMASAIARAG